MQIGKWVPLDKRLAKFLPKTRKYEELEAAFSLSIDYDNQNDVTVSGYASLWGWSRTKVNSFLDEMGVEIIYPGDTKKNQKQKGQIKKQKEDRKETEKRQIRFIDSKWLDDSKNRKKTGKKQEKNRSKDTTSDPSLEPNPDPSLNTYSEEIKEIISFLNLTCNTKYRSETEKTKTLLKTRLSENYTVEDFKAVILKKFNQWVNTKDEMYLRPETLFGNKFEGYLNQKIIQKDQSENNFNPNEWDPALELKAN